MARKTKMGLRWVGMAMVVVGAYAMMGMPEQKKPKAVKTDVQYIRCGVCEEMTRNIYRSVKAMRDELRPGKKLAESDILELLENVCDPEKEQGEWITMIDLVESGDKLKLERQDWPGKCGTECRTIARACDEIMGDHDTDLAEMLYDEKYQRAQLNNFLCYEESNACVVKAPPLPKDREPGPKFEEMTEQDLKMQKMMREMGNMPGMPGMQMFSRDQLQEQMENGDYDDDEVEDEDIGGGDYDYDSDYGTEDELGTDDDEPPSLGETVGRSAKAIKDGVVSGFEKGKKWASEKFGGDKKEL
mmetsp:Transcript_8268/g.51530  ORF Transcript_8268/g.51530 Transcript_8268/m.51530 type:complete len:301 (-) Transcript_8268:560-1462(-)